MAGRRREGGGETLCGDLTNVKEVAKFGIDRRTCLASGIGRWRYSHGLGDRPVHDDRDRADNFAALLEGFTRWMPLRTRRSRRTSGCCGSADGLV